MIPGVLQNKSFRQLYFAGLTSELGSFITETALMLYIFEVSGSDKSMMGITRTVFLIFLTIGGLIGGPLGEKFNRKGLLIFCEAIRIPVIISLMLYAPVWMAILCNGLIALFTGIFNPSRQAMINELVNKEQIKDANSLYGTLIAVIHLAGPFLGALGYSIFAGIFEVLIFDLTTFILGIILLFSIKYEPPTDFNEKTSTNLNVLFSGGVRFLKERKDLQSLFMNNIVTGLAVGVLIPLLLPFTTEILQRDNKDYGILLTFFGLGGIVGGWLCKILSRTVPTGRLTVYTVIAEVFMMMAWLRIHNFYLNLVALFLWGVIVFIRIPAQLNYLSETVETAYLTRMHSFLDMAFVVPNITGGLIVAVFGDSISTFDLLNYIAILFALLVFPRLPVKGMRELMKSRVLAN